MVNVPAPGTTNEEYWLVQYTAAQNSVSSRLDPTGGVAGTATDYLVIYAASSSAASASAKRQLGSRASSIDNITGPYNTQSSANAAKNSKSSAIAKATQAGNFPDPFSGLAAIGDFFARLTKANTWIRVGEVLLGLILLAVGVARVTNAVPIATKIAKTAGTGALLA
jgi:hypothetical protein